MALCLSVLLFTAWAVGQVFRDVSWITALCFYVPSILLACLLGVLALLDLITKRFRAAVLTASLAAVPAFFVLFVENSWLHGQQNLPETFNVRLVHWNVCRGKLGWDCVQKTLIALDADIYVLSEIPDDDDLQQFAIALPSRYSVRRFSTMAVIAKGEVSSRGRLMNSGRAFVHFLTWRSDGVSLSLLAADFPANPLVARDPHLQTLCKLVKQHQPDLVVGDLNAPRRSRALCALPDGYRHAYHSAGSGLGYTWPVPVPMYSLDHCIHGTRVLPSKYQLQSTSCSDHRLQVLDFSVSTALE
jgi:endonuclease/exonuclease/phosphatase (EEP) superfamily protein YafD